MEGLACSTLDKSSAWRRSVLRVELESSSDVGVAENLAMVAWEIRLEESEEETLEMEETVETDSVLIRSTCFHSTPIAPESIAKAAMVA